MLITYLSWCYSLICFYDSLYLFLNFIILLSLQDIFVFSKCTINPRNLIEGEQVLNSNQDVQCGKIVTENVSF